MARVVGEIVEGFTPPPLPGPMVLDGRYLTIAPLTPADAPALHAANRVDDTIWDYLPYGPFPDLAAYAEWVASMADRPDPRFYSLTDRSAGVPAGVAALMRSFPEHGTVEVGHICLSPALQRTRAASEMVFLFADWVFSAGYRRFEWKCDALNLPSRRAAERFGFAFEGVFRQHLIVKGRNRDTAWFAMTDREWPCLKAAWRAWLDAANFDQNGRQLRRLGALTSPCHVAVDPGP